MKREMKRKLAFIFVIVFALIALGIIITGKVIKKDPVVKSFSGIISDYTRLYPGLVIFNFENQDETYSMATNLDEFKNALAIGDSVVKAQNELYIYIYKKENEEYKLFKRFIEP